MKLPFTIEEFLDVFRQYNVDLWPVQVLILMLGLAGVFFSFKKTTYSDKLISAILSFLWLWMGVVYHLVYFSKVNKAAILFGALFILQSLLFLFLGVIRNRLQFRLRMTRYGITGIILVSFAVLFYPLIGYLLGHEYPAAPGFGLPCPTTIFTFGILLFASARVPIIILIIPFLWSLIGFSAALQLDMKEDFSLLAAGVISIVLIAMHNRLLKTTAA